MSLKSIDHSIDIAAASSEAYREWAEFSRFPSFMESITRVTIIDPLRSQWELRIGGLDWQFDALVTASHPGRLIEWSTTAGEIDLAGRAVFEELTPDSCRLTLSLDWTPHGPVEHLGSVFGDDSRVVKRELENFRDHVEAGARNARPGAVR